MTNGKFDELFGGPARTPEQRLTQREMDLAASVQAITEEVMLKLAHGVAQETGEKNLCLAGGVALNCVANGKLLRKKYFDRLWMQPAAGDAGGALGAAYVAFHTFQKQERSHRARHGRDARRLPRAAVHASPTSRSACAVPEPCSKFWTTEHSSRSAPNPSPTARRSAGSRAAWSSARARSAHARSWAMRARRRCRRRSTSRSSTASRSGRSRRRCCAEDAPKYFEHRRREPVHAAGRRRGGASTASR